MTIEEAKTFLDNLKVCIEEHPIVADWLVEIADRKTEPLDKDINVRSKTEPSFTATDFGKGTITRYKDEPQTEECPFDDAIPCEWVCTEYGKCKYKPKTEPQTERSE